MASGVSRAASCVSCNVPQQMMLELRVGCSLGARVRPGTGLVDQMMGNGPNMPGLLQRARQGQGQASGPLSGDVLRAFDTYNRDLEAAASGLTFVLFKSCPLSVSTIYSLYKTINPKQSLMSGSSPAVGQWQSPSSSVYKGAGKKCGQLRCGEKESHQREFQDG